MILRSSSGSLSITLDAKGNGDWSKVHLLEADVQRPLGAERLSYIATHLAAFLEDTSSPLHWVFSLSELHTCGNGEHIAGEAILHLQDVNAKWFAKLVLTAAEKRQWLQELLPHTAR
jgi:hypothetical protein